MTECQYSLSVMLADVSENAGPVIQQAKAHPVRITKFTPSTIAGGLYVVMRGVPNLPVPRQILWRRPCTPGDQCPLLSASLLYLPAHGYDTITHQTKPAELAAMSEMLCSRTLLSSLINVFAVTINILIPASKEPHKWFCFQLIHNQQNEASDLYVTL